MFGRRLLVLLLLLAVVGIPAGVLRAMCAGNSCRNAAGGAARIPFCPLPAVLKDEIVAGFREGRSPDVLAVTNGRPVLGGTDPTDATVPWPTARASETTGVPILFAGTGVDPSTAMPVHTGLDQIAPTLADVIGFERPFPNVRAGVRVEGMANGERPRLILEVGLKGIGTEDVDNDRASWPFLRSLLRRGAGTLRGTTGSLPLDPAATLTTIGTGGLPSQHGVTGTFVRNDAGDVVRAWSDRASPSVIATLPDDLDEATGQRAMIGLVATDPEDRGLIGGDWYPKHDEDAVAIASGGDAVAAARRILAAGFGTDGVPDVLAVVLERGRNADARLREIVGAAERASGGSVVVAIAGTGENGVDPRGPDVPATEVVAQVEDGVGGDRPIVAAAVPGGLFLDQQALAALGVTGQAAVDALLDARGPDGETMMADAFQGFAVSFARYC